MLNEVFVFLQHHSVFPANAPRVWYFITCVGTLFINSSIEVICLGALEELEHLLQDMNLYIGGPAGV